jgi:Tfp pilus assembly protein PilF
MVKKIVRYSDIVMEVTWLLALMSIPIYFNIFTSRVFEPDKITLFRSLALVMAVAWLAKWLAIWAGDRSKASSGTNRRSTARREEAVEPEYEPDGEVIAPDLRPFPRNFLLKPLILPALALVFVYAIATVFSVVPGVSWWGSYQRLQGTYTLTSYVVMFLVIAFNLRERRQVERLVSFVLLTNIPVALYGLLQHFKADPLPWQGDVTFRVTSTMGNAIFIAAYLIMVVPFILYRAVVTGNWLVANRRLAARSFKGRQRNNALSWIALYACFVIFEVGLFFAVLNFSANYHPDTPNAAAASQLASTQLVDSSKRAVEFNQFITGDTGGPWWALPVGIALTFGLYFLFTVRRAGTDNNYLFRIFEFTGYVALGAMTFMTLLYSQSRGPLAGLLVALFLFPPILFWRRKMWRWLVGWLGLGAVAGGVLFLFNLPPGTTPLEPVFSVARQNPQIARFGQFLQTSDGTGRVRELIWKTDFEIMQNAAKTEPLRLFVGYGPESLYNISPPFYQPELGRLEARNAVPDRSHNGYLDALVTTGGIGLLTYIGVVLAFFFYAFKFLRRTQRFDYQVLLTALIALMVAHQIEIQTGIQIAATWMMFWTALALVVVLGGLITGGYGRVAVAEPETATPVAVEEPEPEPVAVAVAVASHSNGAKSGKNGKNKAKANQPQPVATMAQAETAPRNGANRSKQPPVDRNRNRERDRAPRPGIGGGAGRISGTPALAMGGAFGIGGAALYTGEQYNRPVRPWFWAILSGLGAIALLYIYFANYMPVIADAYYKQGTNYTSGQQWGVATPYFKEAINFAPSEDYYYLFLGQSYLEQARALASNQTQQVQPAQLNSLFTQGEQALMKAHDLAPLNPDHYANIARLYALWSQLIATRDQRQSDTLLLKSISWYEQAVNTRAPRNARIRTELAVAYLNYGLTRPGGVDQNYLNKAIQTGEESVKIDDQYDFNRQVLGDIYMAARQPDKAGPQYLALAQIAVKGLNSDNKYDERIKALAQSPQITMDELVKTFTPAKTDTTDVVAFRDTTLGGILYYRNALAEAERELTSALKQDNTNAFAHAYLAMTYAKQGRTNEAQVAALDAVNLARNLQDNQQTLNLFQQQLLYSILNPASGTGGQPQNPPNQTQNPPPGQTTGPSASPGPSAQPSPAPTTKP